MRRLLILFLLVFLPFQSIWAAASPYCNHEAAPEAAHFGHHVHEHDHAAMHDALADASSAQDDTSSPQSTSATGADMDCHACHGAGSAVFAQADGPSLWLGGARPVPWAEPALTAPCPFRPERPNWQPLA